MQLTAKLIQVMPIQTGMGKNGEWRKQSIILETDGMYPKKVCITLWGDKINESLLQIGNILDVSFDIESREYNGRSGWCRNAGSSGRRYNITTSGTCNSSRFQ